MADIGALIVKIGADSTQFLGALSMMGRSMKDFQHGMLAIGKISATAFGAAAAAAQVMTIRAGQQAEQLEQLAEVTGINTDALQDYEVALNRAGLGLDNMEQLMTHLSRSLDEAKRGTGTAGNRFRQLGIDITKVTSTQDLIDKVTAAQARFAAGTAKSAIMSDLLGKNWVQQIKFMKELADEQDNATKASDRF